MKNILSILVLATSFNTFANDLVAINLKDISSKAQRIGDVKVKLNSSDLVIESVEKSTITIFSKGSFNIIIDENKIQYNLNSTEAGFRKHGLTKEQDRSIENVQSKNSLGTLGLISDKSKVELKAGSKEDAKNLIQNKVHELIQKKTSEYVEKANRNGEAQIAGSAIENVKLYCDEALRETTCMGTFKYSTIIKLQ